MAQGKCHYYDLPELRLRDLQSLLSFRKRLKKQVHSYRVRIRNNWWLSISRNWTVSGTTRGGEARWQRSRDREAWAAGL